MGTFHKSALAFTIAAIAAGPQSAFSQGLEEVIVTAQKREEGLQDVPIAVEAFSKERIDNLAARDIYDIGVFTSNVSIGQGANQPSYSIRGIGTSDFGIGADPAVGVYRDGVYIGRSGGSKIAFNDIKRVEILNGPQGTLFGRNAAAGAIQYITNKADLDSTYGWARATLGNYNRTQVDGVANVPISDKLGFRGGLLYNEREGFIDNVVDGNDKGRRNTWSLTGQLRFQPTDNLDIIWRAEYDEVDQDSAPTSSAVWLPRNARGQAYDKVASDEDLPETRELWGTSLHLTWDMPWATLTSISYWREYETYNPEEKDGSAEILYRFNDLNAEDNRQYGQEFRFDGELGAAIRWSAGVNVHIEDAKQTSGIDVGTEAVDKLIAEREVGVPYDVFPPGRPFEIGFLAIPDFLGRRAYSNGQEALDAGTFSERIFIDAKYESYAAFADVTWDVTDSFSLTGGLRYTNDKKDFGRYVEFNEFVIPFAFQTETWLDQSGNYNPECALNTDPSNPNCTLGFLHSEEDWSRTTPRLVADWRVTDDVMIYASYAEGYKAGGFNSAGEILAPPFDPEDVTNYELGFKTAWLDNTLRFNGAVFYYEYDNLQALRFIEAECLPNSSTGAYIFETSDVEGDGFEMSLNWLATTGLEFWGNMGNLNSEYTRREERRVNKGVCEVVDRTGEDFKESLNYNIGATYTWPMNHGGEMLFSLAYSYLEGNPRSGCKFVETNPDGTGSVYSLSENADGVLEINRPSATGSLTAPPFDSCSDAKDRKLLNGRVAYFTPSRTWEVAAWVRNATDWGPDGDPGGLGGELASQFSDGSPSYTRRDEPRMYGLELRYNFGS